MVNVFIFLEGGHVDISQFKFEKKDILICADGGIKRILNKKLENKIILFGDFDSVKRESIKGKNIEIKEFPIDKDITDGQLAYEYACKTFPKNIKKNIIGGLTDRLDHTLGNIFTLIPYIKKGHQFEIYGDRIKIYLTSRSIKINTKKDNVISLIALEKLIGAKTIGLRWKLNNESIFLDQSRTLRNEAISETIRINFKDGILMVIESW